MTLDELIEALQAERDSDPRTGSYDVSVSANKILPPNFSYEPERLLTVYGGVIDVIGSITAGPDSVGFDTGEESQVILSFAIGTHEIRPIDRSFPEY
jgi:hypothetical protein